MRETCLLICPPFHPHSLSYKHTHTLFTTHTHSGAHEAATLTVSWRCVVSSSTSSLLFLALFLSLPPPPYHPSPRNIMGGWFALLKASVAAAVGIGVGVVAPHYQRRRPHAPLNGFFLLHLLFLSEPRLCVCVWVHASESCNWQLILIICRLYYCYWLIFYIQLGFLLFIILLFLRYSLFCLFHQLTSVNFSLISAFSSMDSVFVNLFSAAIFVVVLFVASLNSLEFV